MGCGAELGIDVVEILVVHLGEEPAEQTASVENVQDGIWRCQIKLTQYQSYPNLQDMAKSDLQEEM